MIGARAGALREKLIEEAKERQREAVSRGNRTRHREESPVVDTGPQLADTTKTRDLIGKLVGVSGRTIQDAVKVIEKGILEKLRQAADGE